MLLLRKDVPKNMIWDVTRLFQREKHWQNELIALEKDVENVTQYEGKLHESAAVLLKAIQALEQFQIRAEHVFTYALLCISVDGENTTFQANYKKASNIRSQLDAKLAFFESELLQIPHETIEQFFKEEIQLEAYKPWMKRIFQKKTYMLSTETEKVLAAFNDVLNSPYAVYEESKASDMTFREITDEKGKKLPMSEALYEDRYELSSSALVRKNAYESFTETFERYEHTYAAVYATEINKQVTLAKVRGYASVIDMLLENQLVTRDMYEMQLEVIYNELPKHMRKLAAIKEKELGLSKIQFYDLKAPLVKGFEPEMTFEKGCELILEALSPLGDEYMHVIKEAFRDRWIDYAANRGKQAGAFCASPYQKGAFILLTWTNEMRNVFTLAHEPGHAGHFYLAQREQNFFNTDVSMYFVEAPSTMNELFLGNFLLENEKDRQTKRWVLSQLLETYYHNFVTHFLEAILQDRLYKLAESGTPLTAEVISSTKLSILKEFWGDTVEIDERARLTWMRQPHYYMGLYPYTYSARLTIATIVFQRIKEEGEPMVARWLKVLKAGGSKEPLHLCNELEIDMKSASVFQTVVNYIGSLVDLLETTRY